MSKNRLQNRMSPKEPASSVGNGNGRASGYATVTSPLPHACSHLVQAGLEPEARGIPECQVVQDDREAAGLEG